MCSTSLSSCGVMMKPEINMDRGKLLQSFIRTLESKPRCHITLNCRSQAGRQRQATAAESMQWECGRGRKQVMHVRMHSEVVPSVGRSQLEFRKWASFLLPPSLLSFPLSLSISLPPSWSVQCRRSARARFRASLVQQGARLESSGVVARAHA